MKVGPLPVITGLNDSQLQLGHRVTLPEARAALQLIFAFNRSPMAGRVTLRSIDVSNLGVIVAMTARGGEITFGLDNPDRQLRRWREIYDLGRRYNKAIAAADFAVTNNVPVRWTESLAPPAVAPQNSTTLTPMLRRKNV